jgi:hypothetical protein
MSVKAIIKNHEKFESAIEEIIRYAQEVIANLPYRNQMSDKEKHILLEALILRICALWEKFIEAELIYTAHLDTKKLSELMEINPDTRLTTELIRALIFSDIFRNFGGIDGLVGFSKNIIERTRNPFTRIKENQKKNIQFAYKIRNYLSHYSGYSKRVLFLAYKKKYYYKRFLEPGKFLLKNKGKHFESIANSFKITSIQMRMTFKGGTTP